MSRIEICVAKEIKGPEDKTIYVYKEGDSELEGTRVPILHKKHTDLSSLLNDLTSQIPGLPSGVLNLVSANQHKVTNIDELVDEGKYVASGGPSVQSHQPWKVSEPPRYNSIITKNDINFTKPVILSAPTALNGENVPPKYLRTSGIPKKITVMLNGEPHKKHIILVNPKTMQSFESLLSDISAMFKVAAHKLYTVDGQRIKGLSDILKGPDLYVVSGRSKFKPVNLRLPPFSVPSLQTFSGSSSSPNVDANLSKIRQLREFASTTQGRWVIKLKTNDLPEAATDAQVMLTVYGKRGVSPTIPLGIPGNTYFNNGQIDVFKINIGKIGEIFKIRLSHDNSGQSPSWLCDEVRMKDQDTGETLVFPCKKWLSEERDYGEITRELPALRTGTVACPVLHYEVAITIGDLWNAGTNATLYINILGERGDSGLRRFAKLKNLRKGQTQIVYLEAVCLGILRKVTIGHDGVGPGAGLFLEKIDIKELTHANDITTFYCGQWLDEGQADGNTFRDLSITTEPYSAILSKKLWEAEKWKFATGSVLNLYNKATCQALRLRTNKIDVLGKSTEQASQLLIKQKYAQVITISTTVEPLAYVAIDRGLIVTKNKLSPSCELSVNIKPGRTIVFESLKFPDMNLAFNNVGLPSQVIASSFDLGTQFTACPKGIFLNGNVILLSSSLTQTLALDHGNQLHASGNRSSLSNFIVHDLIAEQLCQSNPSNQNDIPDLAVNNEILLESVASHGTFIRLTGDTIDCMGTITDPACKFNIILRPHEGYVLLKSIQNPSSFIGISSNGTLKPLPEAKLSNIRFWPEVVQFALGKLIPSLQGQSLTVPYIETKAPDEMHYSPSQQSTVPEDLKSLVKQDTLDSQKSGKEQNWDLSITPEDPSTLEQLPTLYATLFGTKGDSHLISLQNLQSDSGSPIITIPLTTGDIGELIKLQISSSQAQTALNWKITEINLTNESGNVLLSMANQTLDLSPGIEASLTVPATISKSILKPVGESAKVAKSASVKLASYVSEASSLSSNSINAPVSVHSDKSKISEKLEATSLVAPGAKSLTISNLQQDVDESSKDAAFLKIASDMNQTASQSCHSRSSSIQPNADKLQLSEKLEATSAVTQNTVSNLQQAVTYKVSIISGLPAPEDAEQNCIADIGIPSITINGDLGTTGQKLLKNFSNDADSLLTQEVLENIKAQNTIPDSWLKVWDKVHQELTPEDITLEDGSTKKIVKHVNLFSVDALSLGSIQTVEIAHDNNTAGNGWLLQKVIIEDTVNNKAFTATCNQWLDSGMGDQLTKREFSVHPIDLVQHAKTVIPEAEFEEAARIQEEEATRIKAETAAANAAPNSPKSSAFKNTLKMMSCAKNNDVA